MKEQQDYRMDELLRQRLQGAEAPVPAGMWARIQDARQQRRPHPFGWAGFGVLVLLTAAFAGWMTLREVSAPEEPDTQPLSGQTALLAPERNSIFPDTDRAMETAGNNAAAPAGQEAGTDKDLSSATAPGRPGTSPELRATRPQDLRRDTRASGASASGKPGAGSPAGKNGQAGLTDEQAALPAIPAGPAAEPRSLFASATPIAPLHSRSLQAPVSDLAPFELTAPQLSALRKTAGPSCYSFNSFLRGLSMDLYMAPEYASRQLVYKDPAMIDYAERRKDTEAYAFAFSAGFRANAHFEGGLALRTGLIYTDIVEKFTYADPDAEIRRVITVSIDTIYNPPDVIIMVDTLSIVEYGQYDKVGYNNYRFYDVPLILGYEIDHGRWIMSLNTGVMLNVATTRRGSMLDPSANLVSINSSRADSYPAFRKKVGSSLLMSLGVNYALRPKLYLLFEPQLRVWMRPLNIKDYPVDQKYMNLGLAVGLRQYF